MEVCRCINCMSETASYPCPHCGYDGSRDHELESALMPGRILNGKYLVGRVLGQGGFGITYIGFDLNLERRVAIKEYFSSKTASRLGTTTSVLSWYADERTAILRRAGIQSVLDEARKMAKLESIPQAVGVREAFEENNTAYIVMDFVEGRSLKEHLVSRGPMGWEEAEKLFLPVIGALEKIHQAGLIHRDISPDNLMVLPDGTIKLLDLGAAKDISGGQDGPSAEVVKNGFSPFEQYTQRGSAGPWSDVYAMAATILYSLTGKVPPSAVDRVTDDPLNWNMPELKKVPQGVRAALRKAMMVQMKERTQSMSAFAADLQKKAVIPGLKKIWIPVAVVAVAVAAAGLLLLPKSDAENMPVETVGSSTSNAVFPGAEDVNRLVEIICHPVDGESYTYYKASFEAGNKETNTSYRADGSVEYVNRITRFNNGDPKEENRTDYNEFGEITRISTDYYEEDGSFRSECTAYEDGDISSVGVYYFNEHRNMVRSDFQMYSYGKPGDYSSTSVYTLEYDEHDNLRTSREGDESDGSEEIHTYVYDADGNVLSDVCVNRGWYGSSTWESSSENFYQYDSEGNTLLWGFVPDVKSDLGYQEEINEYERYPDGRTKTRTVSWDGVVTEVYEYVWEK